MTIRNELDKLLSTLTYERDQIKLKLHLASMEIKDEFEGLDQIWDELSNQIVDSTGKVIDISDEALDKATSIGKEIQQSYKRILDILSD